MNNPISPLRFGTTRLVIIPSDRSVERALKEALETQKDVWVSRYSDYQDPVLEETPSTPKFPAQPQASSPFRIRKVEPPESPSPSPSRPPLTRELLDQVIMFHPKDNSESRPHFVMQIDETKLPLPLFRDLIDTVVSNTLRTIFDEMKYSVWQNPRFNTYTQVIDQVIRDRIIPQEDVATRRRQHARQHPEQYN